MLEREGIPAERARAAALAAQGHIGRARRLATDEEAARRRGEVLRVPGQVGSLGDALERPPALVKAAGAEADATTAELDEPEREALRRAFGEGSTGKGVATCAPRRRRRAAGSGGPAEVAGDQAKRDALDRALLDLAGLPRRAHHPARRVG